MVKCGLHTYLLLRHANNKRRRSACTSVQSDQRICYSLPGKYNCQACFVFWQVSIVKQTGLSLTLSPESLTLMHANNKMRRSACTYVQSDQRICYFLPRNYSCHAFQYSRKVRKRAKIRNRYNQAPHLTQDTKSETTKTRFSDNRAQMSLSFSATVYFFSSW